MMLHEPQSAGIVLTNEVLQDKRLSLEALGFLVRAMSLEPDWDFRPRWIAAEFGIGKDKAYRLIKELVDCGYCRRHVERAEGRFAKTDYRFDSGRTPEKS